MMTLALVVAAVITSLIIYMIIGKRIIKYLQLKQIGETVRNLGLEGETANRVLHQWEA